MDSNVIAFHSSKRLKMKIFKRSLLYLLHFFIFSTKINRAIGQIAEDEDDDNRVVSPVESFEKWINGTDSGIELNDQQLAWFYSLGEYHSRGHMKTFTNELRSRQARLAFGGGIGVYAGDYHWPPYPTPKQPDCDEIPGPMRTRMEFRVMTPTMRDQYVAAILALVNFCPDGCTPCNSNQCTSAYDILVIIHRFTESPSAHFGAAFYGWHREYLLRLENALIRYGNYPENLGLPYWDSILDSSLPNAADTVLWTPEFMGNNKGQLGAPFATMTVPKLRGSCNRNKVRRNAAGAGGNRIMNDLLFTESDIAALKTLDCFAELTQNPVFSCSGGNLCNLEDRHSGTHAWVGGHMRELECSPSDPIFWLYHAFIDYMWEKWRNIAQLTNLETEYPLSSFGIPEAVWNGPMAPFPGLINVHGLSTHYTVYYYEYSQRPSREACKKDKHCNPLNNAKSALWCDRTINRCRSKIREGGSCVGLTNRACWCSDDNDTPSCTSGVCICS